MAIRLEFVLRPTVGIVDRPFGWANSSYPALLTGLRLRYMSSVGYAGLGENQSMQEHVVTNSMSMLNGEQTLLVPQANYTNVTNEGLELYGKGLTTVEV